ncbi:hypothetical protein RN001_014164 [Aquatica leii]|uniref:Kynurenine formamidase n=1 Tax=Aquatica leii TaxID=1421715 RepID=A0AAN7PRH1_9COLE|nr:hypothetical protein RN001_014164 [Aquatica leii]
MAGPKTLVSLLIPLLILLSVSAVSVISHSDKIIDLTWHVTEKIVSWPGSKNFVFIKKVFEDKSMGQLYTTNEFAATEHIGTHIDAPYHFDKRGWKIGDIPLSHLIGHCITINLSDETNKLGGAAALLPKHLIEWEQKNGPIPNNSILLVNFNWGRYFHNKVKYYGGETLDKFKFPGITPEAAQWIVDSGNVLGVGVDAASADLGNSTDFLAHKIFLRNKIYIIENVKFPESFPEKGYWLTVMPMLIKEGTGAPARVVAYSKKYTFFTI